LKADERSDDRKGRFAMSLITPGSFQKLQTGSHAMAMAVA
jgi:hypothetical protein